MAAFKTTRGADRYTALAGGAWAEVILRSYFGWRPAVARGGGAAPLWGPAVPRGVRGELSNIGAALRNITLTERGPRDSP